MYRFYVESEQIKEKIVHIIGTDVNHIKNVLRMKNDEKIIICDGKGKDYICSLEEIQSEKIVARVLSESNTDTELKTKIVLFQGLPKKDKMELIIQKAVELGVYEIIPVITKRTIVKLDDKKKELKKLERWQAIGNGAAKQSGRGFIPKVGKAISFKEAVEKMKELEYNIIPYENAKGMKETKNIIREMKNASSIGVLIGPEGGFDESEIELALTYGIKPITLGKRILRTETAGLTTLSILMFELED